jgi:AAA ATPase domain
VAERMAQRLAARRRQEFVGREPELALLETLLRGGDGGVLFVSGPGGVGKTTLLDRFAMVGAEAGRRVVRVDARDVAPVAAALLAEIATQAGFAQAADPLEALGEVTGLLLLLDTTELLTALDRWIREELLPRLGADTVAVLAGREPPSTTWRTDPGWQGLVHTVALQNLSAADSAALLERRGVPSDQVAEAFAFTRGHPLALALVADVVAQGGDTQAARRLPGVVGTLVGTLIDSVPSVRQRRALDACAQVMTTTEPLLAVLLDDPDVGEVFAWLRGLSIIESGPRGLFPHDVAREALNAELRWRHPEQYAEIHRRAGAYYRDRFYSVPVRQQQQVLVDYVFLHRDNPVLGPLVNDTAATGLDLRSLMATPATEEEATVVREIVASHEGPEAADLAEYWMMRQPGSMLLVRGPDGEVLGLAATVALQGVTEADRHRDVAVDRVCSFLDSRAALAPEDVAGFFRFWMQRDRYQELGPVQLFITLHFVRYYLSTPRLAATFVYYADPELWADICAYADLSRLHAADFEVGGRSYGVYWHDWRRTGPLAWLELLAEREIAAAPLDVPGRAAAGTQAAPFQLADADFARAVKDALTGLGRADGLRDSPLLRSALVISRIGRDADERTRSDELRQVIREAAARLEGSPRDRRAYRALHHTYLQPASTQAAAAELLDLPMTTYRRHLAEGIHRLTEILRQEDLDAALSRS